jgi:DNA-binding MarR family transcriptional regulator
MPDPRGLDEREKRMWHAFHDMRRRLDTSLDQQLARDAALSAADHQLLVPLFEAPDQRLRPRDLCRAVGWDRSRLSHQMRRMEQRGLVSREECCTDARGTVIRLTEEGRQAIQAAEPGHVETVRRYFIDLLSPEEVDALTSIAQRVLERITRDTGVDGGPCGPSDC